MQFELPACGGTVQERRTPARTAAPSDSPSPQLLFHEDWWLAAVTQGRIQQVTVTNGSHVVGRLPFTLHRKMGLTRVRMPPFTHVLGPAVDAGEGKAQTQLVRRLSIVRALLDQLPRFDFFHQAIAATTADGLAFQDRGFQIRPQYTFQIDCRRDLREIWHGMHTKTRQHVRRAEEKLTVATVEDAREFVGFYLNNLRKRRLQNYTSFASFETLFDACRMRDSGEILSANWPDGTPTAMVYLVWGNGTMYYLLSTRAEDAGDNGSINMLIWAAIKRAHDRHLVFDFDGVYSGGAARFLSGFGGRLEMRLIAQRSQPVYSALQGAKSVLFGGRADKTRAFT